MGTTTHVSASVGFTCATRTDQTIRCWGRDGSGQLGDGTTVVRPWANQPVVTAR